MLGQWGEVAVARRRIQPIFIATVVISIFAVASAAVFADLAVTHRDPTALVLDRPAAIVLGIAACLCWLTCRRDARDRRREERDRDRTILIKSLARTLPMGPVR